MPAVSAWIAPHARASSFYTNRTRDSNIYRVLVQHLVDAQLPKVGALGKAHRAKHGVEVERVGHSLANHGAV